ncbi:hypothetical protein [Nitrospira sp. Nam80]
MFGRLTVFTVLCITITAADSFAELSVSSLWKGVAFEARNNVEKLQDKLKQHPWESKQAQFLRCQIMVQFAFVAHISHEEIAHKREEGFHAFHILLNGGEEHGLFDLVYVYTNEGEHSVTRLDLLPKGWNLTYVPNLAQGMLGVRSSDGQCIFGLDLNNPFHFMAIDPSE